MSQAHASTASHGDHGHGHHDPHLAHHFDSMGQQVASGKLGMWIFLATEILMFGGLFCAYAVWRANHYEAVVAGFQYLDTMWGAINTGVLITSSFTMAWAVRTAQLGKQKATTILLALTLLGGFGFMTIKYIEYSHKYEMGLFIGPFGKWDEFQAERDRILSERQATLAQAVVATGTEAPRPGNPPQGLAVTQAESLHAIQQPEDPEFQAGHERPGTIEVTTPMAEPRHGDVEEVVEGLQHSEAEPAHDEHAGHLADPIEATTARTFFSIYFLMTGLHGIHVLIGMGLIAWVLVRAARGEFTPRYNAPVDLVGLYWHLVDLIWIFLFPLLYLIK